MIKINDLLDFVISKNNTTFKTEDGGTYDRDAFLNASEAYDCPRKLALLRAEKPAQGWGFFERGKVIEDWFVARFKQSCNDNPQDLVLMYAGSHQITRQYGKLSATPDGLLINTSTSPIDFEGITIPAEGSVVLEIKSVDPRTNLDEAKPAHVMQASLQIALFHKTSPFKPVGAVIVYIDASDFSNIRTFPVSLNQDVDTFLNSMQERADMILNATDPYALVAEGKRTGCKYCPFTQKCKDYIGSAVLAPETELVGDDADRVREYATHINELDKDIKHHSTIVKKAEEEKKVLQQAIIAEARKNNVRTLRIGSTLITYKVTTRVGAIDQKKLTEVIPNLDEFRKEKVLVENVLIKQGE